ncbi:unnamed protein product [Lasius platythorax]|uniref:Uncharacterized protein n=1 Tax=Lasius platythorax TaxID=488582 RepID=A0AAV2NKR5_9HYME
MRIRSCVLLKFCPSTDVMISAQASALVKSSCHGRIRGSYRKPNGQMARKNDRSDDERLYTNDRAAPRTSCTSLAEPSRAATCDQEENVDHPLTMMRSPSRSLTFAGIIAAAPAPVGRRRCGHSKTADSSLAADPFLVRRT